MKILKGRRTKPNSGFWITLLVQAAIFVLQELLRPKPTLENAKPAGLGDFNFPTATEDRVVPLIWGTVMMSGPNVIWYGDFQQEARTIKVKTGLFTKQTQIIGFRYHVGIQFGLCRGANGIKLLRILVGDDEVMSSTITNAGSFVIDKPDLFGGDDLGNGGLVGDFQFFDGRANQIVSPYLATQQLVGGTKTPAYRGTCYLAPLVRRTYIGNSTQLKPWKFELRRIPNGLSLSTGDAELNGGNDCNPANVLYELLTDDDWGLGQDASDIDTASFTAAAETLAAENNGFSMILDSPTEATQLKDLIEQQISGRVYFNSVLGKWQMKLARADYAINTVPVISEANASAIKDFTRGSWEGTTNIVMIKFNDRDNEYMGTSALAQDGANIRLQLGKNISTRVDMPGVKNAAVANDIAWRTLRTLSYPLAKAKFVMDRSFYDANPVDVFAFTSSRYGLTKMPMRVTGIDLGDLDDNRVTLDVVQDVFYFQGGSFGAPDATNWTAPVDTLVAFPVDEQLAFEAPRAFLTRDPDITTTFTTIWAGGRRQNNEVTFKITERHSSSTPSGDFNEAGESFGFMLVGELSSTLSAGVASPTASIVITNAVDSQTDILEAFDRSRDPISGDEPSATDIAANLINLILVTDGVNEEFMLVTEASASGGSNVSMQNVYRGVLDSAQHTFAAGTKVYLIAAGGNLAQVAFPETDNVHIKLLPRSRTDLVLAAAANQISLSMDKRVRRPYCPSRVSLGGTPWATTVGLEQTGSGLDGVGFQVAFIRRDYRWLDEIAALTIDAESLDATFPAANSTVHDMQVREDPAGTNTLLFTTAGITGKTTTPTRTEILHAAGGTLPTSLRVVLTALHDDGADTGLESRQGLSHDFSVTSTLTGQFEFGDLDTSVTSAAYTVDAAGVHTVAIGTAFPTTGDVQYRVNGGSWTAIIPQGSTSGSTTSLSVSDTMEVRHTSTDIDALTHLQLTSPGGTSAWAILFV